MGRLLTHVVFNDSNAMYLLGFDHRIAKQALAGSFERFVLSHKFDNKNGQSKKAPRQIDSDMDAARAAPSSDCDKSEVIGDALKTFYQNALDEAVPDDFQDLLDKLN